MKNFCEDNSYFISKEGKVYSNKYGYLRQLKTRINEDGYEDIKIKGKTYKIHRLVGEAYIPNPENKPQINHKDCNKLNNYDWNLEWATNAENQLHAWQNGLQPTRHATNCKFTQEEANAIRKEYMDTNISQRELAKKYDVSKTTITDLLNGKYYNLDKVEKSVSRSKHEKKLTFVQAEEIRERYSNEKISFRKLGSEYGVDHSVISNIIKGKTYVQQSVTTIP